MGRLQSFITWLTHFPEYHLLTSMSCKQLVSKNAIIRLTLTIISYPLSNQVCIDAVAQADAVHGHARMQAFRDDLGL